MRNFDSNFNFIKRVFFIMFFFCVLILIGQIVLIVFGLSNPEVIGEFFGKIINGFNSVK